MNVLLAFMFGIAVISLHSARSDGGGLGRLPLLVLCTVVAFGYLSQRVI